ncbi:MAG: metalloregulator ArsR/SmtB family transcription factor [Synergistaceae bacterium]|jgi:ArsR family transcriptional regulator|nr:metalloregulator ArsR/SmtB family transcription factor [Synergistaceae bacterium]
MPFMNFMNITRALSDENRVRILMALRNHRFCVCEITAFLDLSPSTTSKHLSVLKQARLIEGRKEGKWVYYRLADSPQSYEMARSAIAWVRESIGGSREILEDEAAINDILENEKAKYGIDGDGISDEFHSPAVHSLESD